MAGTAGVLALASIAGGSIAPAAADVMRYFGSPPPPLATLIPPQSPAPISAKDFTIVSQGGVFHVFYISHDRSLPVWLGADSLCHIEDSNERRLGHAVSVDLENWAPAANSPTVLDVRPGMWDATHVWAPSITPGGGGGTMFYTGVVDSAGILQQRIGIATSNDLDHWTRSDTPSCTCAGLAGSWANCVPWDFRDAFVMRDPVSRNGEVVPGWLMYYVTHLKNDPARLVVGMARNSFLGLFTHVPWTDLGPVWGTYRNPWWNSKVESPHLLQHDGTWYLFFTGDAGILVTRASDPASPSGWSPAERLADITGLQDDAPFWFASETFSDDTGDYLAVVSGYDGTQEFPPVGRCRDLNVIEFRRIAWRADGGFDLVPPNPARALGWTDPASGWDVNRVPVHGTVALTLTTLDTAATTVTLEAARIDVTPEVALDPAELGLPDHALVHGGSVRWVWTAQSPDPTTRVRIVVRVANQPKRVSTDPLDLMPAGGTGTSGRGLGRLSAGETGAADAPIAWAFESLGPHAGRAAFSVVSPGGGIAHLDVFDLRGRRVCRILDGAVGPGTTTATWDTRDAGGRQVASGVYFARLSTPAGAFVARVLVTR